MKWCGGLLCALLLTGALIFALGGAAENPPTPEINSQAASINETIAETIAGIGYVEPIGEVRRLGFKIDGRVRECRTEIRSAVKAGETLIRLDDSEEQTAVRVAQAEVEVAKANLLELLAGSHPSAISEAEHQLRQAEFAALFAAREHHRQKTLNESKSTSETEADKAELLARHTAAAAEAANAALEKLKNMPRPEAKAAAESRLALAEAKLSQAQAHLEQTTLLAPSDGTVLEVFRREGDVVRAMDAEPAILFANLSQLRVRAEVDERFVHGLRDGLTVEISGRPLGTAVYEGRLSVVKQMMGPKTVFSRAATERLNLDVVQLLIDMPPSFQAPVGLRVDVKIRQ